MNRKMMSLIVSCCVLTACLSSKQAEQQLEMNHGLKEKTAVTSVEVRVDQGDIPLDKSPEQALLARAESRGMDAIIKEWLNSGLIFQIDDCPASGQVDPTFIIREGQFSPRFDEMTNTYSSRFRIQSEFRSCRHLSGGIIRLSEGKTITGQYQEIFLTFNDLIPEDHDAYFLIARPEAVGKTPVLRLIGGGRIMDVLGRKATGMIQAVNKEIKAGDSIFLVRTSVQPIEPAEKAEKLPEETRLSGQDEVMVRPREEPKKLEMPAEPK